MIVNNKLYTIFDEVDEKPLPIQEECIMVEQNTAKARKEVRERYMEVVNFINEKFATFDNDTKKYLCGQAYNEFNKK